MTRFAWPFAVLQMSARWLDLLPDLRFEVKECIDAGEYVIVPARIWATPLAVMPMSWLRRFSWTDSAYGH
jgi:hypothetical protein